MPVFLESNSDKGNKGTKSNVLNESDENKGPAILANSLKFFLSNEEGNINHAKPRVAQESYDIEPTVPTVTDEAYKKCNDHVTPIGDYEDFKAGVFHYKSVISYDDLKLHLNVYAPQSLSHAMYDTIKKGLNDTVNKFKSSFGLDANEKDTTLELYLFDNQDQYEYYGKLYNLGISGSGGMTFYGDSDSPYRIYVYKFGEILNLKHELAHAMENYASGHALLKYNVNHNIFSEGLADYVQNDHTFIMKELRDREITSNVLKDNKGVDDIDKLTNAAVADNQYLSYSIGHAFVTFLQENHPGIISEYLKSLKEGNFVHAQEIISMNKYSDFEQWVQSQEISLYLENMNLLKLDLGKKIFSAKNAQSFDSNGMSNEYYYEGICNMKGEVVGEISPIVHYAYKDTVRTWNIASPDMIEISPEYNFLKLVKTSLGEFAYVYCDKDGNEYFNSKSYIEYAFDILKRYDADLRQSSDVLDSKMDDAHINEVFEKIPNADLLLDQFLDKMGYGNHKQTILNNPQQLNIVKVNVIKEAVEIFKENEVKKVLSGKSDVDAEARNLLMDLTYIDLDDIVGVNGFDVKSITSDPDVMLRTSILGKGDVSGISLSLNDQKVAELSTEGGYCVKHLDTGKVDFVFRDVAKIVSSSYHDRAYMVILENNGNFTTALVNDIQKAEGGTVIWDNQFNHPSINHIHIDYQKLLLNDASVKDYAHAKAFHPEDKVIVPGIVLDDKGTVTTDDDVHQAIIKHDDQILHQFKSMSFYIDEPTFDSSGTYGSNFFITDEGKNIMFQLPKTITHLKLVNINGNNKLVPCTNDGNEHPDGMPPNLTDEYRYIDPVFAHTFEKQCYSKKSVNIGLVDFSQYKEGSMFKLQHYSDDYHINKDEYGNVIRANNRSYVTKVDLSYDNKIIGMLSDNINQFQGDIFISVSRNYSHNDFLSSKYFQKVSIETLEDGVYSGKYIVEDQIANLGTDTGYSDQAVFYFKDSNTSSLLSNNSVNASTILPYSSEF